MLLLRANRPQLRPSHCSPPTATRINHRSEARKLSQESDEVAGRRPARNARDRLQRKSKVDQFGTNLGWAPAVGDALKFGGWCPTLFMSSLRGHTHSHAHTRRQCAELTRWHGQSRRVRMSQRVPEAAPHPPLVTLRTAPAGPCGGLPHGESAVSPPAPRHAGY